MQAYKKPLKRETTICINKKMDARDRKYIKAGIKVSIVQNRDKASGQLTQGVVKDILTEASFHPYGIEVRLKDGLEGRVKEIRM